MVQVLTPRFQKKTTSQQFGEAFSHAAIGFSQAVGEKRKKEKEDEATARFLKDEYGIDNTKDVPKDFLFQAQKGKQETAQFNRERKEEEDYLTQVTGDGQEAEEQPGMTDNARSGRSFEDEYGATPEKVRPGEEAAPGKKAPARKFDYNNPESWSDKEINKLRAFEGKTPKAKTFAKMAQNEYDRRQEAKKVKSKYQENVAPLEGALEILDRMEKLGKTGNLGIGTKVRGVLSPEARKQAAEYERLGKSLISYASNIPIRNRSEFEVLAHDLYDPSISDASREGILQTMKRIIQTSMKQYEAPEDEWMQTQARQSRQPVKQERPPLTAFIK